MVQCTVTITLYKGSGSGCRCSVAPDRIKSATKNDINVPAGAPPFCGRFYPKCLILNPEKGVVEKLQT